MLLMSLLNVLDVKSFLGLLLVSLLVFDFWKSKNAPNFPPGPWGFPFLGNVFIGFNYRAMDEVAAKFGNIFSLRMGYDKIVVVSGYEWVKEVLVTQGDNFLDRAISPLFQEVFQGNGISMSSGHKWRKQRHFIASHLKAFAEGKTALELHIQQECIALCQTFEEEQGCPFNPHDTLNNAAANVIGCFVFGKRFDHSFTDFQNLLLNSDSMFIENIPQIQFYKAFPGLAERFYGSHKTIQSNYTKLTAFIKKQIEKQKKDWDPFDHRDFIDAYIGEIDKRRKDTEAAFTVDNLACITVDLLKAGTQTMSDTLRQALLLMIKYPKVQEKVQDEIDCVIGKSRQPCLVDRASMPYTNAVIHETQRVSNILPLIAPRLTSRDSVLAGYFIPKGTMVICNLCSVLKDSSQWKKTDQFYPEHFLDDQRNFRKREVFYPFSAGKRSCLGEQLARNTLFLFFTSLLQRFSFSAPEGPEPFIESQERVKTPPKPFQICVSLR
ncbi:cytochrome P450 2J2-like [Rhinichthys klamathensis goyatoka]|uniref:cytochrome P450 2J2-like n=1 Tax=Rhinichthys klamathensis goyatoka TaxID=3034132 RepID=UPI0024B634EC|nr:cytochrome P450 2J2-like [Rhinichthys klamathensis goyatoka]